MVPTPPGAPTNVAYMRPWFLHRERTPMTGTSFGSACHLLCIGPLRRALRLREFLPLAVVVASGIALVAPVHAQRPSTRDSVHADSVRARVTSLGQVTITATRTAKDVFDAPAAVTVIDSAMLRRRLPNTPVDGFRDLPGLDVTGVGTNQARPTIRGLGGQRILLLEDGLRLNNSRRQQDFGELPAIAGMTGIDRVEVVRGPSSVLYGTDAIGGVVNVITAGLPSSADGIHGWAGYRYSTADNQQTPSAG